MESSTDGEPRRRRVSDFYHSGILVVDDVQDNLDLMEALLVDAGFEEVYLANNGQRALELLAEHMTIGVVLLDLMMPDMDGYAVCQHITADSRMRHVPVIVVTGAAFRQNDALERSFNAGAIDFIHKPLNEVELLGRIRVALTLYSERMRNRDVMARLAEKERRFHDIIDQAPVGIAELDGQGRVVMTNRGLQTLLGEAEDRLVETALSRYVVAGEAEAGPEAFAEALAKADRQSGTTSLELQLQGPRGMTMWCQVSLTPRDPAAGPRSFVAMIEDITERKKASATMERMAFFDALTHLPNRVQFGNRVRDALYQASADHQQLAILFLDLDDFKVVNDSRGHDAGDRLLCAVADRIRGLLRADDLFARFGGDEFALLLPRVRGAEDACIVAHKILNGLDQPIPVHDERFYVGASIGVSFYPQDGEDAETLIKNADAAMYRAKELGRRNYQLFNPAMNQSVQERLNLEYELRRALDDEQFELRFQPVVSLEDGGLASLEVCLRWTHPTRGPLDPSEFLPLAEETGLILRLGRWVIDAALGHARNWFGSGAAWMPLTINLSPRELQHPDLLAHLDDSLERYDQPPSALAFELTEAISGQTTRPVIRENIAGIQRRGIGLVMDDFGQGQASLNALRELPLSGLKVDPGLLQQAMVERYERAVVETTVTLGRELGIPVVAEGLETPAHLAFAQSESFSCGQGTVLSPPLTPASVPELLAAGRIDLSRLAMVPPNASHS